MTHASSPTSSDDDPLRAWYQTCLQVRWAGIAQEAAKQHRSTQDCFTLHAIADGTLELESYKYRVELGPGDYAVLPSGFGFHHRREGSGPYWSIGFVVLPLPGALDLLAQAPLPLRGTASSAAALEDSCACMCRALADQRRHGLPGRLRARALLDGLVTDLLIAWIERDPPRASGGQRQPEWLQAAYQEIQRRYMRADFALAAIAADIGISLPRLQHGFRDCYGITPGALARRLRLELARHLLRANPELSIADIARRCGFASPASFSNAFRRQVGTSPLGFRHHG